MAVFVLLRYTGCIRGVGDFRVGALLTLTVRLGHCCAVKIGLYSFKFHSHDREISAYVVGHVPVVAVLLKGPGRVVLVLLRYTVAVFVLLRYTGCIRGVGDFRVGALLTLTVRLGHCCAVKIGIYSFKFHSHDREISAYVVGHVPVVAVLLKRPGRVVLVLLRYTVAVFVLLRYTGCIRGVGDFRVGALLTLTVRLGHCCAVKIGIYSFKFHSHDREFSAYVVGHVPVVAVLLKRPGRVVLVLLRYTVAVFVLLRYTVAVFVLLRYTVAVFVLLRYTVAVFVLLRCDVPLPYLRWFLYQSK